MKNTFTRLGCLAAALLATSTTYALDAAQPPGKNFDLTHWKLTLPIPNPNSTNGTAQEKTAKQLAAGFTNETHFFTDTNGAMVCWCPSSGAKTPVTKHPRTELREMMDPLDSKKNWTADGIHILDATCTVNELARGCRTCIGQIHGRSTDIPLVMIRYDNSQGRGNVTAVVRYHPNNAKNADGNTDATLEFGEIALNQPIQYRIAVTNGVASVTVNGKTESHDFYAEDAAWKKVNLYFKAGNYYIDNGKTTNAARVSFTALTVRHLPAPEKP